MVSDQTYTDGEKAALAAYDEAAGAAPVARNEELAKLPRNDTGNARRLIARYGHELAWVPELGWLAWDGKRWVRENGDAVALERAQQTVDAIYAEADHLPDEVPDDEDKRKGTPRARHYNFAVSSGNGGKTKSMLEMAAPKLRREQRAFDSLPYHFNVQNGTLRLDQDVKIYGHRATDKLTRMAAVAYEPEADCPRWQAFIATILPDKDTALFVQKWLGYCLTGDISEQCFVMFDGKGSNGKSTMLETVSRIIGDYSGSVPIESFLHNENRSGSGPSPDLARLPGIRLIRTSEPEPGARLSESRIKQWTGGEDVSARHLNRGFFDFLPTGKITMSCNIRPRIVGKDEGIKTRVLLVPFKHRFARRDSGRKPDYVGMFVRQEGAGILNWLLDGYRMWAEEGLDVPNEVREATDDMFNEQDPIGQAIKDVLEDDPESKVQASALVIACEKWFKGAGEEVKTGTAIGRRMKDLGYRKKQIKGLTYYIGVRVKLEYVPGMGE